MIKSPFVRPGQAFRPHLRLSEKSRRPDCLNDTALQISIKKTIESAVYIRNSKPYSLNYASTSDERSANAPSGPLFFFSPLKHESVDLSIWKFGDIYIRRSRVLERVSVSAGLSRYTRVPRRGKAVYFYQHSRCLCRT